jgi:Mrp family chromosome partitioning ATPase/capsular polysaccharide biosynthesis protein
MTVRQDRDDFAAEPRSLDLRDYWLIVRRRWRLVTVIAVLGVVCALGYSALAGPTYTAQASVVVSAVTQGPQGGSTPVTTPVNMSTEQAIAQSAAVIQAAAAKLGVPVAQLEASAAKRLSVSVPASTLTTSNVLQVDWQADQPALAQQGADAFAAAYLAYRHHLLQGQVALLRANLQQQVSTLKKEINNVSSQLSQTLTGTSADQVLTVELTQVSQQYNSTQTQLAAISAYNVSGGQFISAPLPSKPSGLGRSVLAAIGLILGLLIGLAAAFARDLFDDRIRDSGQLEQQLGAVTLAVLPSSIRRAEVRPSGPGVKLQSRPVIAMAAAPESAAADSARALRAAVLAVSSRRDLRVILLVAADASVSSGQVAAELGVALAESGRRALLVASDLRGSVLPRIFEMSGIAGLSELLSNGGDPEMVIRRPQEASWVPLPHEIADRLSVLTSGQPTPFALSMLDSGRMQDLLLVQRECSDLVVLDAPPATVADVLPLCPNIDGVIVLVRERQTAARDIDALRHRLEQAGTPIVGGVLISGRRPGRGERPGRDRRHFRRPSTTATWPVIEGTQLSALAPPGRPEVAAPQAISSLPADSEDSITAPLPGDSLKRPR